jgi:hypothetical protein
MKIIIGTVSHDQLVVEGQPFAEGRKNESFRLSPTETLQLRESIAQADRGEFVDAERLLAELEGCNRRS